MDNLFEKEVKEKMKWSLSEWQKSGDKVLEMKRLINSMKYWSGRLESAKRPENVILTLHQENKRAYPSLQQIAEKLSSINNEIIIQGYAKFRNKRYLSLSFDCLESRDFVVNNLTSIQDAKIAYLHWIDEVQQDLIIVQWLSNETDLDLIVEFFDQFMEIKSAVRVTTTLDDGRDYISGNVELRGKFKQGVVRDCIPHVAVIDGLECLILIQGRPYQCLTCSSIGHKAANCYKAFCQQCKIICSKNHVCMERNVNNIEMDYSESTTVDYSQEAMEVKENIFVENIGVQEKKHIEGRNLFQDNKLNLMMTFGNRGADGVCQAGNVYDQNAKDLESVATKNVLSSEGKIPQNWFTEFLDTHRSSGIETNDYITDAAKVGDPNYILMDTSSSESDSDGEGYRGTMEYVDSWKSKLDYSAQLSRKLLDQTSLLLKSNVEVGSKESTGIKSEHCEEKLVDFQVQSHFVEKKIEDISKQIMESDLSIQRTGCRNKVKKKKVGKKKK